MQPSLFSLTPTLTVTQLIRQIKDIVEADQVLRDAWIRGEVSNFSQAASGHVYFTLKDASAAIRCVMWRSDAARAQSRSRGLLPKDGDAIEAHGKVSVYETRGDVQLYVDEIKLAGAGALWEEFERLRLRLDAEGLFAIEHKRPLPKFPRTIGIVTSREGAVLHDICNVLSRRFPLAQVLLAPVPVQGDGAPAMIVDAIQRINATTIDVLIVGRGGGSIEDLWAFNDEGVAHAIYRSRVPVISAVGHETDFTIADFVADVRAPTPSAAAELAVPDGRELRAAIRLARQRLVQIAHARIDNGRARLSNEMDTLERNSPQAHIVHYRQRVDDLSRSAHVRLMHLFALRRGELIGTTRHLDALNPQATLARGYAVVREKSSGQVVKSTAQVVGRKEIQVRVRDGEFEATSKS